VAALTQGVLKAMFVAKLKIAATFVLALGLATGVLVVGGFAIGRAQNARTDQTLKGDDANAEIARLQGKWQIVLAMVDGKEPEGEEKKNMLKRPVVFDGNKVKFKEEATFTIDPGKNPKQIDLVVKNGPPEEVGTWKGIYKLQGDELTLCLVLPNATRPTDFVINPGELDPAKMASLLKLKRIK
jgi:uncharacterized protein (TIGR03067 family)